MKIHLIAVGNKQPVWVTMAYQEYAKRLNQEVRLHLIEIATRGKTKKPGTAENKQQEARLIRARIPEHSHLICLDEGGKSISSQGLAVEMQGWLGSGRTVSLLIGGSDGLHQSLLDDADERWSLSAMTLPHGLVRVLLAEQLYRAWSILKCHPYHRS